jgi:hypothetical protein
MTPSNLAIVFGPGLLRPAEDAPFNPREQSLVFGVLEVLIERYDRVFGEIEHRRAERAATLQREREDHQHRLQQASQEVREAKAAEFARALERTESKDGVDRNTRVCCCCWCVCVCRCMCVPCCCRNSSSFWVRSAHLPSHLLTTWFRCRLLTR